MKYIVKNCPNMTIVKGQDLMCFDVEKMHGVPCQNRTDCVIKQIVEKCKKTQTIFKGSDNEFTLGKLTYAEFILKDLEIEEVE